MYAATFAYLAAFATLGGRYRKLGGWLYTFGFVFASVAFVCFWVQARHPPLQNLFGVFLCLGALVYPLSLVCRRFLGVKSSASDALIAFALLVPATFVFRPELAELLPALQSPLLGAHVGAYMLAYVILLKAGALSVGALRRGSGSDADRRAICERNAYRLIRLAFPLLTLGLVLGAVWGEMAWGDYWHWDPKELWSLAMWLVYVEYFQVRSVLGTRRPRVNGAIAVAGAAVIIVTLLWVNLGKLFAGLHSYAT
jgi:ABC-type transport system involved in cytochrome c biogenesis permease subunit